MNLIIIKNLWVFRNITREMEIQRSNLFILCMFISSRQRTNFSSSKVQVQRDSSGVIRLFVEIMSLVFYNSTKDLDNVKRLFSFLYFGSVKVVEERILWGISRGIDTRVSVTLYEIQWGPRTHSTRRGLEWTRRNCSVLSPQNPRYSQGSRPVPGCMDGSKYLVLVPLW